MHQWSDWHPHKATLMHRLADSKTHACGPAAAGQVTWPWISPALLMFLRPQIASELLQSWELLQCLDAICLFIGFLVTHICKVSFTTGSNICSLPMISFAGSLVTLRPLAGVPLPWMELAKPSLMPPFGCWAESWSLCFALTVEDKFQSLKLLFSSILFSFVVCFTFVCA